MPIYRKGSETSSIRRAPSWASPWFTLDGDKKVSHSSLENVDCTTKDWFINSIGSPSRNGVFAVFTHPYIDPDTNELIITVAQEVKARNEHVGTVALDISFNEPAPLKTALGIVKELIIFIFYFLNVYNTTFNVYVIFIFYNGKIKVHVVHNTII